MMSDSLNKARRSMSTSGHGRLVLSFESMMKILGFGVGFGFKRIRQETEVSQWPWQVSVIL